MPGPNLDRQTAKLRCYDVYYFLDQAGEIVQKPASEYVGMSDEEADTLLPCISIEDALERKQKFDLERMSKT